MQRGDLSNALTPVWLVAADVILETLPKRKRFETTTGMVSRAAFSRNNIGALWLLSFKVAARWELVTFELPKDFGPMLLDRMDIEFAHPVQYVSTYGTRQELASTLAYRPEVQYVMDLTQYALGCYGARGIDLKGAFARG